MDSSNYQVYILQKELRNLIKSEKVTTWGEVVNGLRTYITEKELFDFKEMKVKCKNDDLENIFGLEEFTILDIKDLLQQKVFPINRGSKDSAEIPPSSDTKRKADEFSEGTKSKKTSQHYQTLTGEFCLSLNQPDTSPPPNGDIAILHIPTSPNRHESESDVDSVQCYETSFIQDTSDGSVFLDEDGDHKEFLPEGILTIAETFELEYEPASSSEDFSLCDSNTDSDGEFLNSIITFVCKTDSDEEFFADKSSDEGSSSESSVSYGFDVEISEKDLWKCSRCLRVNNPPNRFCSKCFDTRKGWLAEKARERRKPRSKPRKKQKKDSLSSARRKEVSEPTTTTTLSANSKSFDLPCTSKESPREGEKINKICLLCCTAPVNSTIIHGKYGHSIACYTCCKRLQNSQKRCPICRRTIEKVVYISEL